MTGQQWSDIGTISPCSVTKNWGTSKDDFSPEFLTNVRLSAGYGNRRSSFIKYLIGCLKSWCLKCNETRTLECSEKDQNCKLQFPQPDHRPRHSPDFRTVSGIMIGPFSSCEIGKTWGTNKQANKQTNKN